MRTIVYIDGFNLYFGIRDKKWRDCLWLNLWDFSKSLLKPNQTLSAVKYFTSRVSGPPDKVHRQGAFLEAVQTLPNVHIYYGQYLTHWSACLKCNHRWPIPSEKMTDVNIATELTVDAFQNHFDCAILISGDSDLVAPIQAVKQHLKDKRVVVAFPPNRHSNRLKQVAHAWFSVSRQDLVKSQFPNQVVKPDGVILNRPGTWA